MFTTGLYTRLLQACDINSECKLQTCHRLVLICLLSQACVHMQACGRPVYLACHLLVLQACKEHVTVLLLVSLKLVTSLKFYHLATFWFTIRDCTVFSIRVHQLEQYQHLKKSFCVGFWGSAILETIPGSWCPVILRRFPCSVLLPQLESWGTQSTSEQSCDRVLFHSISVLRIQSTPNSECSSLQLVDPPGPPQNFTASLFINIINIYYLYLLITFKSWLCGTNLLISTRKNEKQRETRPRKRTTMRGQKLLSNEWARMLAVNNKNTHLSAHMNRCHSFMKNSVSKILSQVLWIESDMV